MQQPFTVTSFVIRFIHTNPGEQGHVYRGVIRHVQTDQEVQFSHWEEAQAFMQGFIPLNLNGTDQEQDSNET